MFVIEKRMGKIIIFNDNDKIKCLIDNQSVLNHRTNLATNAITNDGDAEFFASGDAHTDMTKFVSS